MITRSSRLLPVRGAVMIVVGDVTSTQFVLMRQLIRHRRYRSTRVTDRSDGLYQSAIAVADRRHRVPSAHHARTNVSRSGLSLDQRRHRRIVEHPESRSGASGMLGVVVAADEGCVNLGRGRGSRKVQLEVRRIDGSALRHGQTVLSWQTAAAELIHVKL